MRAKLNITDKYQETALDNATSSSDAIAILKAAGAVVRKPYMPPRPPRSPSPTQVR